MSKTGELTTQQLVTIIILIVSFSVILFFIFRLNLGETTNKEICHNSVLMKEKSLNPISSGPLDCRTNYICISGGEKCEDFSSKQEIVKIDLEGSPDEIKNQTMKAIADEMADCWWMFGEGKVDYVGLNVERATVGEINCALCSRIKFGKDIQSLKSIDSNLFEQFLASNEKNKGVSYLYYLYKTHDLNDLELNDISLEEEYSILTGIGKLGVLKKTANWFAGGFDAFNAFLSITPKFKDYGYMQVTIKERSKIDELKCDNFLTKA